LKDKHSLRNLALNRRKLLSTEERSEKSLKIIEKIKNLPEFCSSYTVMVYLNFRDEVETTELARDILLSGKRLLIPLCGARDITACEIKDIKADVHEGMWGIREPRPDRITPVAPEEIDLVIVPGAAFDFKGNRIGYGRGYYDRYLSQVRSDTIIIGTAFSCQLVEDIQAEEHDFKIPLLITENGVIYPG